MNMIQINMSESLLFIEKNIKKEFKRINNIYFYDQQQSK